MKKTFYIAGPMRGHKGYNYDAFFEAEYDLNQLDIGAENPASVPLLDGFDPDVDEFTHYDLLKVFPNCIAMLAKSQGILMLDGFENSAGAMSELYVAVNLFMLPVFKLVDGELIKINKNDIVF